MRLLPATLTAAQAVLAQKPEIGAESIFHAFPVEFIFMGKIVTDSTGTPTWRPRAGAAIPAAGLWDLHLRTDDGLTNLAGNPSVTLDVTIGDSVGAGTAVATLGIPSWVTDQSKNWSVGSATDFIPQGSGNAAKDIEAILGVDSAANLPPNAEFSVWASSDATNAIELGYCKSINGPYQVPASVSIADRYESAAAVKKGRSEEAELSLEFNYISSMEGIARYNGRSITAFIKVIKDKSAHSENVIYTAYRPEFSPNRGDGNDEVMGTSAGPYEKFLTFVAP
jgi:hypothetical protein